MMYLVNNVFSDVEIVDKAKAKSVGEIIPMPTATGRHLGHIH
jgi:hypothetical protein